MLVVDLIEEPDDILDMERLQELEITLTLTEESKNFIVDQGWNAQFGARPLKRAIQRHVEDLLSDEIINGGIQKGDMVEIVVDEENKSLKTKVVSVESSQKQK